MINVPERGRTVALIAYDDLSLFEFGQVHAVFGPPPPEIDEEWYRLVTVAERRRVRLPGGLELTVDADFSALAGASIVIVPGWRNTPVAPALAVAIAGAHAGGARIVSICTGALVLASAGILSGRRATTHWRYAAELRIIDDTIRVDDRVLYVDEGDIVTSAGASAGLDMMLHLVRRDYGSRIANIIARGLVFPPHREGDQSQFIERPVAAPDDDRLARALAYMRANLAVHHKIVDLAERSAMTIRSFHRHFRSATGLTPIDWLVRERVSAARDMIEQGDHAAEAVAYAVGFGSADLLRHHFKRCVGVSPRGYRRAFAVDAISSLGHRRVGQADLEPDFLADRQFPQV